MAVYDEGVGSGAAARAGLFVNLSAAALSLALIVGAGVWGYQLIVRDVSGIPVVRAAEGSMRVAPENPGGEIASHRGLSVNEVVAVGEAGGPEDRLVLAPSTTDLTAEDLVVQPNAEANEVRPIEDDLTGSETLTAVDPNAEAPTGEKAPLTAEQILALADQIAAGVEPLEPLADAPVEISSAISSEVPGLTVTIRPPARPLALQVAARVSNDLSSATAGTANDEIAVMSSDLPVGTKLVQLGAFPNPQDAAATWQALEGRFSDYLDGKERVIQVATSGGRTFYRLRAMGFAELADAKRFCSVLEAGQAECIPVVVR